MSTATENAEEPALSPEAAENLETCRNCVGRTRSWPGPIEKQECTFLLHQGRGTLADVAESGDCPRGFFPGQKREAAAKAVTPTVRGRAAEAARQVAGPWDNGKGAALWQSLHVWALGGPSETGGPEWLDRFARRLPCGECARHFSEWVAANPCPWGPAAWEWSVRAHNAVNERIGKAPLSEADARRRWFELPATFQRVVVINLARRADRWAEFNAGLPPDWPFLAPVRWEATDGRNLGRSGVTGCLNSHRAALDAAVRDGVESILVMEDDCIFHPDFGTEAARFMAAVPGDWGGVWIGNQPAWWAPGDKGNPQPVVPGRVARTRWPHRLHCYGLRGEAIRAMRDCLLSANGHADHDSGEFMGSRFPIYFPHPYALAGQRGGHSDLMNKVMREDWFGIPPRRRRVATEGRPRVYLPFLGEFGILILHHIRMIHADPAAEKIVCCERGQECLFPTATGFYYDWENPLPDAIRSGNGELRSNRRSNDVDAELTPRLAAAYPGAEIVRFRYDTFVDLQKVLRVKFAPAVPHHLPPMDVAIVARRREWAPERNFGHWPEVVAALRAAGLAVGILGAAATSCPVEADAYAWNHPNGPTAGTVDLLSRCRLHVGTDTGVSHLAAMLDVPMVVFRDYREEHGWGMTHMMQKVSARYFRRLPNSAWTRASEVIEGALAGLREIEKPLQVREFYSQHGEDRWLWENRDLPARGVFVEVGMGDGKKNSNTLALEESGWGGILVEPDPRRHAQIRASRKARLYPCAVGTFLGWAEFVLHDDPDLSGFLRTVGRKAEVEVRPLGQMLEQSGIGRIDLLSIDTEGTELDVWRSFDVRRHRPRFVVIEWNTVGLPDRTAEILRAVTADGYRHIHTTAGNLIFEAE